MAISSVSRTAVKHVHISNVLRKLGVFYRYTTASKQDSTLLAGMCQMYFFGGFENLLS